jgi:hypothetical protein
MNSLTQKNNNEAEQSDVTRQQQVVVQYGQLDCISIGTFPIRTHHCCKKDCDNQKFVFYYSTLYCSTTVYFIVIIIITSETILEHDVSHDLQDSRF